MSMDDFRTEAAAFAAVEHRRTGDRRSGVDTRSEADRRQMGERRSGIDRRNDPAASMPTSEQIATFTRRLKRALRDDKGRAFFGVANGEFEFSPYVDVTRVVAWLDQLSAAPEQDADQLRPSLLRKAVIG